MKAKTSRDFEIFKREFKKWQTRFGLNGYKVYFRYEDTDCFADITTTQQDMVATARLDNKRHPDKDVRSSAKHEAIHLLINRLEQMAYSRFLGNNDITEATEELVRRLETVIE